MALKNWEIFKERADKAVAALERMRNENAALEDRNAALVKRVEQLRGDLEKANNIIDEMEARTDKASALIQEAFSALKAGTPAAEDGEGG